LQIKTKIVSCHTADSKPVKQEVNGTVILPPFVFPAYNLTPITESQVTESQLGMKMNESLAIKKEKCSRDSGIQPWDSVSWDVVTRDLVTAPFKASLNFELLL
jgi:hypothetical protein